VLMVVVSGRRSMARASSRSARSAARSASVSRLRFVE
jgi:hypothetical protein